jgi:antitoxin PrlF
LSVRHIRITLTLSLEGAAPWQILSVTARGQVTLRKEVLQYLGMKPGDKIELYLLPDARGLLKAAKQAGSMGKFVGLLAGRTGKFASIDEINEASVQGWSGGK